MSEVIKAWIRDSLILIIACAITYKLPDLLIWLSQATPGILCIFILPIGAICSIIQTIFVTRNISGYITVVIFAIYLAAGYIQTFLITDIFGKIICAIGIFGIFFNVSRHFKNI